MTENNDGPRSGLDRTFAPMLSELEDAEVKLVAEHARAVAEVRRLDAELGRIAKVKAVMLGDAKPKRDRSGRDRSGEDKGKAARNRERVMEYVRTLEPGRHFVASDLAKALDMPNQGMGPILAGVERHGLIEMVGMTDERPARKRYRVKAEA